MKRGWGWESIISRRRTGPIDRLFFLSLFSKKILCHNKEVEVDVQTVLSAEEEEAVEEELVEEEVVKEKVEEDEEVDVRST